MLSVLTGVSSTVLRLAAFLFLRIIPSPHLLKVIYGAFGVWVTSFIYAVLWPADPDAVEVIPADPAVDPAVDHVIVKGDVEKARQPKYRPFKTILGGIPGPGSLLLTGLALALNVGIYLMALDMEYNPNLNSTSGDLSFARLGYVSHADARFLVRETNQTLMPIELQLRIQDASLPAEAAWEVAGGIRFTEESTDFTATLTVPLPRAGSQHVFEWRTSNGHNGQFTSAPAPGAQNAFNKGRFTFLSTSCIIPRFPYDPREHTLAIPGMRHLARRLPELGAQFMLFLGDFIYIDLPSLSGQTPDKYAERYRNVYQSPDWQPVGQNLSWIHVLDDHEIQNDWSANTTGVYEAAVRPWNLYQGAPNPPVALAAESAEARPSASYFSFVQGPISVFMLDTRTYRSDNHELSATDTDKSMLGANQLADVLDWLKRPEPRGVTWKVIASSVPLTRNWPVNNQDTWGGFLAERQVLLEALWDAHALGFGTIVLSGDRHEFGATRFPPPAGGRWPAEAATVEFSISPLNQFAMPFDTYRQVDESDEMLKYIPGGTSKFGAISIDNHADGRSNLTYDAYINGEVAWTITLESPEPPVIPVVEEPVVQAAKKSFWGVFGF